MVARPSAAARADVDAAGGDGFNVRSDGPPRAGVSVLRSARRSGRTTPKGRYAHVLAAAAVRNLAPPGEPRARGARRLRAGGVRDPRRQAEPGHGRTGARVAAAHGAPIGQRGRRGRRQRPAGRHPAAGLAPAAHGRGPRPGPGRRPALRGGPRLLRQRRGGRDPGPAPGRDRRASTASRWSGAAPARSTGTPSAPARPRRRRSSGRWPCWPPSRAGRPTPPATGRWCRSSASSSATWPRSRPTTRSTRSRASPR